MHPLRYISGNFLMTATVYALLYHYCHVLAMYVIAIRVTTQGFAYTLCC